MVDGQRDEVGVLLAADKGCTGWLLDEVHLDVECWEAEADVGLGDLLGEVGFLLRGEGVGTVLDEPAGHCDYLWNGCCLWDQMGGCYNCR